jgi:hypothetical protein
MSKWFTLKDGREIHFNTSTHRYWPPDILQSEPIRLSRSPDGHWTITGKGAMWMYAHAAAMVAAAGCQPHVRLAGPPGTSHDLTTSTCKLHRIPESNCAVFEIQFRVGTQLADDAIDQLMRSELTTLEGSGIAELCITGRGNARAYASAAARGVESHVGRIMCWTPADGLVVVYDQQQVGLGTQLQPPPWLQSYIQPPENPVVVGIIGDPNCGKSVFSLVLNHYCGMNNCRGWRLDCDGASPTPDWYLSLKAQAEEEAEKARQKLAWTPDMENRIAEKIRRLREFFDVAIADLPGGDHKKAPPERVPVHRDVMMREVDVFVLIERDEQPSEAAWRAALHQYGLDDRIAVVLRSQHPSGTAGLDASPDPHGTWRGIVRGLDRGKMPDELLEGLQSGLDTLWPVLLQHGRRAQSDSGGTR